MTQKQTRVATNPATRKALTIHFKDCSDLLEWSDVIVCTKGEYQLAVEHQKSVDLRVNPNTNIVSDNSGELERPSHASDITPFSDECHAIKWYFKRYVNNSISRIQRGLEP